MSKYQWYGPSMPFFDLSGGPLPRQSGNRLLKNDLLQLLFTIQGERVMRPGFGTPLKTSVFDNIDDAALVALKSDIVESIQNNEPRVIVNAIYLQPNKDEELVTIRLVVQDKENPGEDILIEAAMPLVQDQIQ